MKNSFHIKNVNVVSPSYELSGVSSGLKPWKYFSALITWMQSLSSVDVHVYLKGYFLFKRLLTLITCVRFLSSVYPRVSLRLCLFVKLFTLSAGMKTCWASFFLQFWHFSSIRSERKAKTLQYKSENVKWKQTTATQMYNKFDAFW